MRARARIVSSDILYYRSSSCLNPVSSFRGAYASWMGVWVCVGVCGCVGGHNARWRARALERGTDAVLRAGARRPRPRNLPFASLLPSLPACCSCFRHPPVG